VFKNNHDCFSIARQQFDSRMAAYGPNHFAYSGSAATTAAICSKKNKHD
jgi:hypothetical protein